MRKLIGMVFCAVLGLPAYADSGPDADRDEAANRDAIQFSAAWDVSCELSGRKFGFHFQSASGDVTEDDMHVGMTTLAGQGVPLRITPALYVRRGMIGPVHDLCQPGAGRADAEPDREGVPTFDVGGGRVLMWLSRNNRPSFDELVLVLVDAAAGKVLDTRDTKLQIKDITGDQHLTVRPLRPNVWQVRLVTEELPYSDTAESFIESWVTVRVEHNRIRLDKRH